MRRLLLTAALILVCLPVIFPLLRNGYFPMHDDMQAMRLLQMDKCVADGQIPCRWVPDMGYGYGYPQFNYYAPLPYYIMEGFHLLGFSFLDSVKSFFVLSVFISAFGMYFLGRRLWGNTGGFVSALFYTYLPYRAVDMYVRGAVGELAAFSVLPFVFLFAYKIIKNENKADLGFTLALSTLFTSHNITSIMILPFLLIWILFLALKETKRFPFKQLAKEYAMSSLWSLGIASFFLIPAWFEKKLVHIGSLVSGYFSYFSHFVGIKTLLFGSYWGYGFSETGAFDEINLSIGPLHLLFAFLGLLGAWLSKKKSEFKLILVLLVSAFFTLFMIHPKSVFLWKTISILKYFQFPWRFLLMAGFLLSLATGSIVFLVKTKKTIKVTVFGVTVLILIFYASFFQPKAWLNINDNDKFSGDSWRLQQTVSILDYLPIYAERAPDMPAPENPEFKGLVNEGQKGTNWQRWKLLADEESKVNLPLIYFPNWSVFVDEEKVTVEPSGALGLVSFTIKEGEHMLYAKLEDTPIRSFSNLITVGSLLAIPIYLRRKK